MSGIICVLICQNNIELWYFSKNHFVIRNRCILSYKKCAFVVLSTSGFTDRFKLRHLLLRGGYYQGIQHIIVMDRYI